MFVTGAPDWQEGDVFLPRGGERFRILAIEPTMDAKTLVDALLDDGYGYNTVGPCRDSSLPQTRVCVVRDVDDENGDGKAVSFVIVRKR